MAFYHHNTLRTLLLTDTRMGVIAVDNALRNYAHKGQGDPGAPFSVNSISGRPGSEYCVHPVPHGWHVRHYSGSIKYELSPDGSELRSFFPGAHDPVKLAR